MRRKVFSPFIFGKRCVSTISANAREEGMLSKPGSVLNSLTTKETKEHEERGCWFPSCAFVPFVVN